jgi:hypothetical protein
VNTFFIKLRVIEREYLKLSNIRYSILNIMNVSDLKTLIRGLSPNERSIVIYSHKYLKKIFVFQQKNAIKHNL